MTRKIYLTGAFVLCAMIFVSYHPGLRMGFYLDDWIYVERAGRTDWANALVEIFDPRVWTVWYRPLQAIQWFIEWQIFGGNPNGYHVVNIAWHAINTLLLGALVGRVTQKRFVGLASAFFFATFTVYISGVNWVGIVDPLATMPYLASVWFWLTYLERGTRRHYAFALVMFALALMSKQTAFTLPPILFLVELWIARQPFDWMRTIRRYASFGVLAGIFALIQYTTQSTHTFASVFGWQVGVKMAFIFLQYLVLFFFPWGDFPSIDYNVEEAGTFITYGWVVVALILLVVVLARKRHRALLLLCLFTLVTLAPVLPFPFIEHRYLYLPIMSAAIFLALIFDFASARLPRGGIAAGLLALLALGNAFALDTSARDAAEWARQLRVPFNDIQRAHATFPPDTRLYFVDPITPVTGGLSGMFFTRYGRGISVGGWDQYARLREHANAFVYYFDAQRRPVEIAVEPIVATHATPALPAKFDAPMELEGFELARATVKRGQPIVVALYWRGAETMETNYTFFAHLVSPDGKLIAQFDGEPRRGKMPTSKWEPRQMIADAIVLTVPADAPIANDYQIRVGAYDAQTMRRAMILDARGNPIADAVTLAPFSVVE
ncbi:MAG: glycosyltransferase family 39 protein [Chloroflexi bacterium]|nr:glycosyltransferase family 39 protein [Chloroflexota bacterium]